MRLFLFLLSIFGVAASAWAEIDFNRDVRPILSDRCFHCHGPDAKNQSSDLRLDSFENATADLGGYAGLIPGDPDRSELVARIESTDPGEVMPSPKSKLKLTAAEKKILRQWVAEGAEYDNHWAFKAIDKPALPTLSEESKNWVRNPIDHFVAARHEDKKVTPQPEAESHHLRRRVALALTGLGPDLEQLPKGGYEAQVDHHLGSIHYAERMALEWLDAARYADTDGYQNDAERTNWPWRDWVIKSFRDNKPFDEFTVEQLAGDMLPDATNEQRLASAFNRNHRQNSEGGALAAEFFVENVIDRVETTSTVWLGLTMGCARCHDHKYDPLSQREFFQFFGYFNNIGESGFGKGVSSNPILKTTSPLGAPPIELSKAREDAIEAVSGAQKSLPVRVEEWAAAMKAKAEGGSTDWVPVAKLSGKATGGGKFNQPTETTLLYSGPGAAPEYTINFKPGGGKAITALRLDCLSHESFKAGRKLAPSSNGNFVVTDVSLTIDDQAGAPREVVIGKVSASFEQPNYPASNTIDDNGKSGWAIYDLKRGTMTESLFLFLKEPLDLDKRTTLTLTMKHASGFGGHHPGHLRILKTSEEKPDLDPSTGLAAPLLAALQVPADKRSAAQRKQLADHVRKTDEPIKEANAQLKRADDKLAALGYREVSVMVMQEAAKIRPTYLLNRGQYDDPDQSEALPRTIPAAILPAGKEAPKDRLELAQWMVSNENPLTARVIVNRVWQQHFGIGLVKTAEDFGVQGELPSHPALLDWLASYFRDSGWDLKALHRLILTSATYRQSSHHDPALLELDPENRLLARGPRFRLDGFAIRDLALDSAGLLNERVGGPPVKPYQPAGLWNAVASGAGTRYPVDKGDKLYRKSVYTYWKRAVNPPRQIIFDAAGREACNVRKRATNTPLQALVLMNDPTFLEAARHLAQRAMKEEAGNDEQRIRMMASEVLARDLDGETLSVLSKNLAYFRERFTGSEEAAKSFLSQGSSPRDETIPVAEHASFTAVAHLLLNLDEAITSQ